MVALTTQPLLVHPYAELINKEVEIIGVSDHLATEIPELMQFAGEGKLRFPEETLRLVKLDAGAVNGALDAVEKSTDCIRTVIMPQAR
jgi:propanol-preferring alcohol dehydrogenase